MLALRSPGGERRYLSQWFLRITAYADRLRNDLDELTGWPERTRTMQRNWIGRSEGVSFEFGVDGLDAGIEVFTTRIDTLYGATFLAVAPEHPVVRIARVRIVAPARAATAIESFAESLKSKSELERTSLMEKQGVFTGAYAINPLSRERIPIWLTNYVLAEYGGGAVMGAYRRTTSATSTVARSTALPIAQVVVPAEANAARIEPLEAGRSSTTAGSSQATISTRCRANARGRGDRGTSRRTRRRQ